MWVLLFLASIWLGLNALHLSETKKTDEEGVQTILCGIVIIQSLWIVYFGSRVIFGL